MDAAFFFAAEDLSFLLLNFDCDSLKISNLVSLAAHYLHHAYRGQNLKYSDGSSPMVHALLIGYLQEEKEMDALVQFADGTSVFDKLFKRNYQSPKLFWRAVETVHPDFAKSCRKIQHIPAFTNHQ